MYHQIIIQLKYNQLTKYQLHHSIYQLMKPQLQFHNSSYDIHLNHDNLLLSSEGMRIECCPFHERKDVEVFDSQKVVSKEMFEEYNQEEDCMTIVGMQ